MPDNAGDRKDVRRREKEAKIAAAQRQDVVRNLMSTTAGREWMWDKLASARVFNTTFNDSALRGAFAEGRRSMGLEFLDEIMLACPDQYIQAQRESNERSATWERRSSPQPDGRDTGSGIEHNGDEAGGRIYLDDRDEAESRASLYDN